MTSEAAPPQGGTVVGPALGARFLAWAGFPLAGALAGAGLLWLLKSVAGWVVSLPWAPLQGVFRLAASLPEPHATIGALAVGLVAGLVIGFLAALENVTATIEDHHVTLVRGGSSRTVPRESVTAVFLDGKQLVLLGREGKQHARMGEASDSRKLQNAFEARGYPWRADDPHADEYRRWVSDLRGLPVGADALFKAREQAMRNDHHKDVDELHDELAALGIAVRDSNKRQYWRRTGHGPDSPDDTASTE